MYSAKCAKYSVWDTLCRWAENTHIEQFEAFPNAHVGEGRTRAKFNLTIYLRIAILAIRNIPSSAIFLLHQINKTENHVSALKETIYLISLTLQLCVTFRLCMVEISKFRKIDAEIYLTSFL